ncbi:MAG: DNA alkylation repair protein [Acidimicrobiia bacterium]|nr:DNA alkylation repair protein [Acidimicrobiia bacterium]
MIDPALEAERIAAALRMHSSTVVDPSPIIRTALPFYGVKVGVLRGIAKAWHREHPDASGEQVAALADALWGVGVREEMVVAALLHGHDRRSRSSMGLRRADRWSRHLDNWETADAMAAWLTAPAVADDPGRGYPMLETLAGRSNPWARRVGLVACIGTGRTPEAAEWWPRVTGIVLRLASDKEAGIPKAISWVLRTHVGHAADLVEEFMDAHPGVLPAIALRETRNKLRTGTKSGRG